MRSMVPASLLWFVLSPWSLAQDQSAPAKKIPPRVAMCAPLAVPTGVTTKVVVRGWGLDKVTGVRMATSPCISIL